MCANEADNHGLTIWANRFNVYVLLAVDVILQIAVLIVGHDSELYADLQEIQDARCWSVYSDAQMALNDMRGDLKNILVLGWLEFIIVIIGLAFAIFDRMKEDTEEKSDHSWQTRLTLVISVVMIFFDVLLSIVDFAVFTVDSKAELDKFLESIDEDESSGAFSAFPKVS